MVKGKARERRQARTREAIIQAAEEIIEEQGPEALNMRDLADRIDYSASNLYEYFSSKDEVIAVVINDALSRLTLHVRSLLMGLSSRERLHSYGHAYLEFARMHPQLYLLIFGRKLAHDMLTDSETLPNPYLLLQQTVAEGIADGTFLPREGFGLHEMTFGCWSLVHGIAMLRLGIQGASWERYEAGDDQILTCFMDGLMQR